MNNRAFRAIPTFAALPGISRAQHDWKWFSLFVHFALWVIFIMPNSDGWLADPGRPLSASQMELKSTRIFLPLPRKEEKTTEQLSADFSLDAHKAATAEVVISLNGLQLNVRQDPTFEMMKVLQRKDGRIGCATEITPRSLDVVFGVADGAADEPDHTWSHYFPLKLRRFHQELPSTYLRCTHVGAGSAVVGYALFPKSFEQQLEVAIRTETIKRGLAGKVIRADIQFDSRSEVGFHVEDVQVESES